MAKIIDPGELDKRVLIQTPTEVRSATGQSTNTFATLRYCWAKVDPGPSRDLWQAQQVEAQVTTQITIRYRSDVTPKCRVVYQSRYFNIVGVPKDLGMKHEYLVLNCIEQAA